MVSEQDAREEAGVFIDTAVSEYLQKFIPDEFYELGMSTARRIIGELTYDELMEATRVSLSKRIRSAVLQEIPI